MVRCRNSENFPVIEIVQSLSAKKITANFRILSYESGIVRFESLSGHDKPEIVPLLDGEV